MDVFVFSSRYEGLGIAAVEAQVSGLRVIASSKIPQEAKISDGMTFLQLSNNAEQWATEILLTKNREILQLNPQNDYNIVKQSTSLKSMLHMKKSLKELSHCSVVTRAIVNFAADDCYAEDCTEILIMTIEFQNCDFFFDRVFVDEIDQIRN